MLHISSLKSTMLMCISILFSSYLYYGLNEMTDRVDDIVSRSPPLGSFTPHPCLNAGFFRNFTSSTGQFVQFYGTSDFANCSAILMPLLHTNSAEFPCYYPSQCSIEGNYQPRLGSATFIAFSNFASVFRRTLLLPQTASIGLIRSTMNTVCNSNMTALHQVPFDFRHFSVTLAHSPVCRCIPTQVNTCQLNV
jgi:hypothetical protein